MFIDLGDFKNYQQPADTTWATGSCSRWRSDHEAVSGAATRTADAATTMVLTADLELTGAAKAVAP